MRGPIECLPFSQKIQKFQLKVKWNSNFPGNCGLPPFRRECQKFPVSQFQSPISRKQQQETELQMVNAISFGWFADFGKSLTIIQWMSQPGYFEQMVSTHSFNSNWQTTILFISGLSEGAIKTIFRNALGSEQSFEKHGNKNKPK